MKKIRDVATLPSLDELRKWREGYQHYLEAKGVTPDQAADIAAKVAYRPDRYPTDSITIQPVFQFIDSPEEAPKTDASPMADTRPAKSKPIRTPKADIPSLDKISSKPKTTLTTVREARLIKTAAEIAGERPDDDDCGYMHSIMCQVGLPRSKVDAASFERHSGGVALLVEAGKLWDGKQFVQQPIPYG